MKNYGEALRYQREINGLSQTELAKQISTSQQNIGRWEHDEVLPSIDFCVQLANYYGITLNELLGLDDFDARPSAPIATSAITSESYTAEEKQIIAEYRKMPESSKELFRRMAGIKTPVTKK